MDLESINQHSPWWSRSLAILLSLMVLGSIANVFYLEIFGIGGINHYSFDNKPENPGDYPHNGSATEQDDYNWSLQEWDEYQSYQKMVNDLEESYATEVSQLFAMLSILIGVPAIAMFWTHNEKMLYFGVAFGATKVIGDVWVSYISSEIVSNYMENVPGGGDYSWIAKTSIFSSGCCGLFFIALAIVLSNMYHSSNEVPESGFHIKSDIPSEYVAEHGTNDDL
tara:strand:- start:32 stop:703 length:672 start_codon:yes stop_codon:yes gene_type:complete